MKTRDKYLAAVATLAADIVRSEYGDYTGCRSTTGARLLTGPGRHTHLPVELRATQLDGWTKYGPRKSTGYVVTDEVLALYDAVRAEVAAEKKAAKKLADQAAAQAAGHATVTAWRRAERERRGREKLIAAEAAAKARAENEQRVNARLVALGLDAEADMYAVPVLSLLECAVAAGHTIGDGEIRAVLYARDHQTSAWCAYQEGDMSASDLLHRCERAQHRHESTDYDELLRAGYHRDDARAYATPY